VRAEVDAVDIQADRGIRGQQEVELTHARMNALTCEEAPPVLAAKLRLGAAPSIEVTWRKS
jgi:hypothetical protein